VSRARARDLDPVACAELGLDVAEVGLYHQVDGLSALHFKTPPHGDANEAGEQQGAGRWCA